MQRAIVDISPERLLAVLIFLFFICACTLSWKQQVAWATIASFSFSTLIVPVAGVIVFFDNQANAASDLSTVIFYHRDHLGSPTVLSDSNGECRGIYSLRRVR